jgi:hypothetical protein
MPGKNRPSHAPHVRAEKARMKRYRQVEHIARAWCVICSAPFLTEKGAHVHEGHVHRSRAC